MSLEPGARLGHYQIVEPIGRGGMGDVYRARDSKLGRDVAIKVLPPDFARDRERVERFEREARLLAQLNHTNVATIYGFEVFESQQVLVMELVGGETLADRIAKGRIAIDEVVALFIQVAEGLEAAHEKGIIHRDLKPANIKIVARRQTEDPGFRVGHRSCRLMARRPISPSLPPSRRVPPPASSWERPTT